jgi:hypothetical protein
MWRDGIVLAARFNDRSLFSLFFLAGQMALHAHYNIRSLSVTVEQHALGYGNHVSDEP